MSFYVVETRTDSLDVDSEFLPSVAELYRRAERRRHMMLSPDPPEFVQLAADLVDGSAVLKVPFKVFFAKLAANDSGGVWKNRTRVGAALRDASVPSFRNFVAILRRLSSHLLWNVSVHIVVGCRGSMRGWSLTVPKVEGDEEIAVAIAGLFALGGQVQEVLHRYAEEGKIVVNDFPHRSQADGCCVIKFCKFPYVEKHIKIFGNATN